MIPVVHVVDALNIGGAERVAINLVNLLPRDRYVPYLCATRSEGPLSPFVSPHVTRLCLERRGKIDTRALREFVRFIHERGVRIVHAHASALFFSTLARTLTRGCSLIWHDHYGRADFADRPTWLYRLATRNVAGIIAVNQTLSRWSCRRLGMPADRIWYVPNLVPGDDYVPSDPPASLPGEPGKRLVCVANFRPQKDHPTLLRAMTLVQRHVPGAHLLLIGDSADPAYVASIRAQISELELDRSVSYLGPRRDVAAILRGCDIGVLSSVSEGLPLALLEYGNAGLAAVATTAGQCPEVLNNGEAGILVKPGRPEDLARALTSLLTDGRQRLHFASRFQARVEENYSARRIISQICSVYDRVLESSE